MFFPFRLAWFDQLFLIDYDRCCHLCSTRHTTFLRNFGVNSIWYLQFHLLCDKLFTSLMDTSFDLCGWRTSTIISLEVFYCTLKRCYLTCIAGGLLKDCLTTKKTACVITSSLHNRVFLIFPMPGKWCCYSSVSFVCALPNKNCIAPPAVFRQKNGSTQCHIMQYLSVIGQIRNRLHVWHKVSILSAITITQSAVKFHNKFYNIYAKQNLPAVKPGGRFPFCWDSKR